MQGAPAPRLAVAIAPAPQALIPPSPTPTSDRTASQLPEARTRRGAVQTLHSPTDAMTARDSGAPATPPRARPGAPAKTRASSGSGEPRRLGRRVARGRARADRLEQRARHCSVGVVEGNCQREEAQGVRRIGAPADLARRDGGPRGASASRRLARASRSAFAARYSSVSCRIISSRSWYSRFSAAAYGGRERTP